MIISWSIPFKFYYTHLCKYLSVSHLRHKCGKFNLKSNYNIIIIKVGYPENLMPVIKTYQKVGNPVAQIPR